MTTGQHILYVHAPLFNESGYGPGNGLRGMYMQQSYSYTNFVFRSFVFH